MSELNLLHLIASKENCRVELPDHFMLVSYGQSISPHENSDGRFTEVSVSDDDRDGHNSKRGGLSS
jgi:hypothetical protein